MSAIRLARGFTDRDIVIKFAGNYHGHVDSLLVAAGSSAATLAVPNSPGVTVGTSKDTLVLRYNSVEEVEAAFASHGDKLAAVILEPICGNMGCIQGTAEFLRSIRDKTREHGAVMILDEVMTGFRVAAGGAQSLLGVEPDLTTMGKIVGGGLPLGAFGGRKEIMQHVLPAGKVFQAGTLSGNPIATAAGIATLRAIKEQPPYEQLEQLATRLEVGFNKVFKSTPIPFSINRVGSMLTLFFSSKPVVDWDSAVKCDTDRFAKFFWKMIDAGIYLPCSQFEAMFVSAAHTMEDIEATVSAAKDSVAEL